ncbi:unnamed protein product [Ectocarpus fasciculatus]
MEMRPMEPEDLIEVKRLHEQCFPVRYDMAFYENVVRGFITRGKGDAEEPLYTQVAVVPPPTDGCCGWSGSESRGEECPADGGDSPGQSETSEQSRRYPPHEGDVSGCGSAADQGAGTGQGCGRTEHEGKAIPGSIRPLADAGGGSGDSLDGGGAGGGVQERRGSIVGLITCQVMPLSRCRDQDRLGLHTPYGGRGSAAHSEVVYILTLGTETSYRRQGIGRALLRRCVWLSRQEESIGAVYLHVITTNPAAHRFYESEGFVQVCCISDYYRINGELYDCYLYALFVNGAQPPGEWGWGIQSLSRRLLSIISFFRRTLGQVPEEGKLAAAVAAAGDTSDPEQQQHQKRGGPEDMEQGEEESRRMISPFAAEAAARGAAVAACRKSGVARGGGGDQSSAAAAATGAGTPLHPAGRGFANGPQRTPAYRGSDGAPRIESLEGSKVDTGSVSVGAKKATVTLWNAVGMGAWARAGAEDRCAVDKFRDVIEVGPRGVYDVSSSGDSDRHWSGLGQEPV